MAINAKRLKILFFIKAMNGISGGAEKVLCQIASGLAASGHEVVIASSDKPGAQPFYPLDPRVKLIGLGIGNPASHANIMETAQRMAKIRKHCLAIKPDVAVGFMHSAFIPLSFALIGTGIPVIASEHIVPQHYHRKRMEFIFLVLSSIFVRKITVISAQIRDMYPSLVRPKMIDLPNPVTMYGRPVTRPAAAVKTILNVGRLDPQKDQAALIAAFAKIHDRFPDWVLRIVGEGGLRTDLVAQVRKLGLVGKVTLPGTTADIAAEYAAADIFAIPSRYESFGLATAEALGAGLPAIGFADCAGTNEVILNGVNGILVAGDDRVQALADALATLMANDDQRRMLGKNAPATVAQFTVDGAVKKWENVLLSVVK